MIYYDSLDLSMITGSETVIYDPHNEVEIVMSVDDFEDNGFVEVYENAELVCCEAFNSLRDARRVVSECAKEFVSDFSELDFFESEIESIDSDLVNSLGDFIYQVKDLYFDSYDDLGTDEDILDCVLYAIHNKYGLDNMFRPTVKIIGNNQTKIVDYPFADADYVSYLKKRYS